VRVDLEIGLNEIRNLARLAVQLDQVGPVDSAQVGSGASLVDAQQRVECLERGAMEIERVRQQFADRRVSGSFVDGLGSSGP
jgi:hypothetical protein